MANEIIHSTLQTNGGQVASVLSQFIWEQVYDPTDLRAVCPYVPFAGGQGSDTIDVTIDAVPGAAAAASSETSGGFSNAAYTTSKFQLAVARYGRQLQIGDLLGVSGGPINLPRLLMSLRAGIALTYTDLIAALFPSITAQVGTTTVDLDVDDIYDAIFQLNNSLVPVTAEAPVACVLHPQQHNDWTNSLRGETGAIQWQQATADMLALRGPGFKGRWNGVDFWQSDSVPAVTTTVDRSGAMFGYGAIQWTYGPVAGVFPHLNPGDVLYMDQVAFIERSRDHANAMSTAILNMYPAVAIAEQARAVEILSDL